MNAAQYKVRQNPMSPSSPATRPANASAGSSTNDDKTNAPQHAATAGTTSGVLCVTKYQLTMVAIAAHTMVVISTTGTMR